MLGLTDTHIAHREIPDMGRGPAGHEKYDSEYVLARRPAFIMIGRRPAKTKWDDATLGAVRDMLNQPGLVRDYVPEPLGWRRKTDEELRTGRSDPVGDRPDP
jgi:hypothetical protein